MWVLTKCTLLILAGSVARADFKPKLHELKCKDIAAVAKEAIAYSLVGAWEPYADHKCFQGERFQFFSPSAGQSEGEVIDPSKIIKFHRGQDTYEIQSVRKNAEEYQITVKFVIAKKPLTTIYKYLPDPAYTGRTGICGFVTNSTHMIVRFDCVDQAKWNQILKKSSHR